MPECQPPPVGVPGEVDAENDQLLVTGHPDAVAGSKELGVGQDHLGWDDSGTKKSTFAVEVGEHQVEQLGALDHSSLDATPFLVRQDERDRIERPRPVRAAVVALVAANVVGHAVLFEQALDFAVAPCQLTCSECPIRVDQPGPVVTDAPIAVHHLVVAVIERAIVG